MLRRYCLAVFHHIFTGMKNKLSNLFHIYGIILFGLLCAPPIYSYQISNKNPTDSAAGTKFIFYWGKLQCDLSETNQYRGIYRCTAADFRQILHSTPYLWTGDQMAERVSFQLESHRVIATRGTFDYTSLIGKLDEAIGQKVVDGQTLQITGLQLNEQISGRIDLFIEASETKDQGVVYRRPPPGASNMLNTEFLEMVVWGREAIYENSNRDFFSETEFWRTVQQFPAVEWAPDIQPGAVRASIQVKDIGDASFDLRAHLEAPYYQQMVENLNNYRHLIKPGSRITLALHTVEEYERLYEKNMYLVADNDPRLALRKNRNTHTFRMEWAGWEESAEQVYLLQVKDANGNPLTVDPTISLASTTMTDVLAAMMGEGPTFWIDGHLAPDISFRLQTPAGAVRIDAGQGIPDTLIAALNRAPLERYEIKIDSLQMAGYDLSALSCTLRFFYLAENLRVRNQLSALLAAPSTAWVKIYPLSPLDSGYAVELELLRETSGQLSIFSSEGENIFTLGNMYPAGRHTVEIPRAVFKQPGKYFVFLNTIYGVGKQELLLE